MKVWVLLLRENYNDYTKIVGVFNALERAMEIKNSLENVKKMLLSDISVELEVEEYEVVE